MKMRFDLYIVELWLVVVLAGGCAIGNKYSYHDVLATVQSSDRISVTAATHDLREYVVSGRKYADFVGLQRAGFGNPWNVSTASGNSLADDMTYALKSSLGAKGYNVSPVSLTSADESRSIIQKMIATGAKRSVLLTLNKWKSDTYMNIALIYDMHLDVLDASGKTLASEHIQGRDNLGGSAWDPYAHARKAVPEAFRQKLEELLNRPEVQQSLH